MEDILILGTDGGEAALDVVKKGELDYTISLCGFRQGIEVVNIIDAYLKEKKEPEKTVVTKTEAFTPEDIEEKLSSLTKADCG
jgi:ABC-type sugar transport system substrate-binding protein